MRTIPEGLMVSVQVGMPRTVKWDGRILRTRVLKQPVSGSATVTSRGLVGDSTHDEEIERDKAIFVYFSEHYAFWRKELGNRVPFGASGENLTVAGMDEPALNVGDVFQIGTVDATVTEPRVPCYDLNIKFDRRDIVKRLLATGQSGAYLSVKTEGQIQSGDRFVLKEPHPDKVAIRTVYRLYAGEGNREDYDRVISLDALPESWGSYFIQRGYQTGSGVQDV